MSAETPPATPNPTPSSGLLLGLEPIFRARKQDAPENDGTDSFGYGHGTGMTEWLRHLPRA